MSTAKHTELPWKVEYLETNQPCRVVGKDRTVAWVDFWQDRSYATQLDLETQKANTDLIVRAVNSHYELLEACKVLWQMIEEGKLVRDIAHDGDPDWSRQMLDFTMTLNKVQAALAHAEPRAHLEEKE